MTDQTADAGFDQWCIVELMGHRRLAGRVTEETIFGQAMCRIDIPGETPVTQYYGGGAVYCLTPTTEAIVRHLAPQLVVAPASRWELPAPPAQHPGDDDEDDKDGVWS